MRILLFGSTGQVGWELRRSLGPIGEVICSDRSGRSGVRADLSDPASVVNVVREIQPRVIVNAAAYTAVDAAEKDQDTAYTVNAASPGAMAREAAAIGATIVHYSTDYVFDGSGVAPWTEDSPTSPLNVYGRTKLEGEHLVREACCPHLVLRTSWVYGALGKNFASTMLRLAAERAELEIVADQFGAPTGADLLADVTAHALRALKDDPNLAGTYHVAATGVTSWHGYAEFVIEWARQQGRRMMVSTGQVHGISSDAYPTPARRPLNSRLDTSKFCSSFQLLLPEWRVGVERMLTEYPEAMKPS